MSMQQSGQAYGERRPRRAAERVGNARHDEQRALLRRLARELFRAEVASRLGCRREAERLGPEPPSEPLLLAASHAEHTLRGLPQLAREHGIPIDVLGSIASGIAARVRGRAARLAPRSRPRAGVARHRRAAPGSRARGVVRWLAHHACAAGRPSGSPDALVRDAPTSRDRDRATQASPPAHGRPRLTRPLAARPARRTSVSLEIRSPSQELAAVAPIGV